LLHFCRAACPTPVLSVPSILRKQSNSCLVYEALSVWLWLTPRGGRGEQLSILIGTMTTGPKIEDHVSVSTACLELSEIAAIVADPRAGAISTFSGTTRDNHFGKKVVRLEYEGYVPMAELELKKICVQVRARWNVLRIALVHRLGVTAVGEASVIIAISSVHRKDSLEAVEFAINTLKATVPIWKLEVYEGDGRVWKENAEWGPGGGCCRKMVPVEGSAKN
ncbi:unnamed protein product, partial [Scytosiphon promiscuus]